MSLNYYVKLEHRVTASQQKAQGDGSTKSRPLLMLTKMNDKLLFVLPSRAGIAVQRVILLGQKKGK